MTQLTQHEILFRLVEIKDLYYLLSCTKTWEAHFQGHVTTNKLESLLDDTICTLQHELGLTSC